MYVYLQRDHKEVKKKKKNSHRYQNTKENIYSVGFGK